MGPLAQFREINSRLDNTKVAAFIHNGQWDVDLIINTAPPQHVADILAIPLQIHNGTPDQALWKLNPDGAFTVSSAWNMIREHRPITVINKLTWNKHISFKCSFLLWRALREKLPTNEKLIKFGQDPKQCCCCYDPGMDTVDHIFRSGNFAKHVWKYFAASCGINCDPLPLHHFIMKWWDADYQNDAHRLLLQAAPVFVCWNPWKNRCASSKQRRNPI